DEIAVMIPGDQLFAAHAGLLQRRSQIVADEIAFLFGSIDAGLPSLFGHRLVLDRKPPDGYAQRFVGLDEFYIEIRPGLRILVFHMTAGSLDRLFDERDTVLPVVRHAEGLERNIVVAHIAVASAGEITALDVGTRQRIADTVGGIVIGGQELLLFV